MWLLRPLDEIKVEGDLYAYVKNKILTSATWLKRGNKHKNRQVI